jgi:predicted dehydrogenase
MGLAHLAAAMRLGLQPAGLCDSQPEALWKAAAAAGLAAEACHDEAESALAANPGVDLVVIATTAESHRTLVERAARAGARAILCEKPMATSVDDCDAMIAACRASGSRLAINHQMRFMDQYRLIRDELASGRFGRLASMTVVSGCFGLAMNGSHYCEAFAWLTGSEVATVTAWFGRRPFNNPRGPQFFDQAGEVRIETVDGRRLLLVAGPDQGHGMTVTYAAAYGHILVDELEGVYAATARKPEHQAQPPSRYGMPWDRWERRFPAADNVEPTRAVMAALLAGVDFPDGSDGRRAVAALAAAYRSAENGHLPVSAAELGDYYRRRFAWA